MSTKYRDAVNRITKLHTSQINEIKYGEHIYNLGGSAVLQKAAVRERMALSSKMLKNAKILLKMGSGFSRSTISRAYYSLYHCSRAVVYYYYSGDDHEAHSKISTKLPLDFPNRSYWANQIKAARLIRNQADYEPYPAKDSFLFQDAMNLTSDSEKLSIVSRQYLKLKGGI